MKRLKRFLQNPPRLEVCEFCNEPLPARHSHVVQLDSRRILCACRPCYLLFVDQGAGRYRSVPDDARYLPDFRLSLPTWEALRIPVGVAFFFYNSDLARVMAFYPSPAGATESLLELDAWQDLVRVNPELERMAPDVEALLVRRQADRFHAYLVPVTACYELVGRIRLNWHGLDGGSQVREQIEEFFAKAVS